MPDFNGTPFFDNHSHRIDVSGQPIDRTRLAIAFLHGWRPAGYGEDAAVTEAFNEQIESMGVVKVLVKLLADRFGCAAKIEDVVRERNARAAADGYAYAKELYEEAGVIGEMVDDGAPFGDPALNCFPTKLYRLFQMDPCMRALLAETESFRELKARFDETVREKIREGFAGIKSHVLELRFQPLRVIEDAEAENCFAAAKAGEQNAFEDVYLALFEHVLVLTQELDFTVHVHTGCTGNPHDLKSNTDPFALVPLMKDPRFSSAHIVLLHAAFPEIRHAALLVHGYPNVWMDIGWTLPWVSLNMEQIVTEVLGIAPHGKVMFGTGQHDLPEMCWMAAKVAKNALQAVLQHMVDRGLLSEEQAQETGEQLLYKNALRLYGGE